MKLTKAKFLETMRRKFGFRNSEELIEPEWKENALKELTEILRKELASKNKPFDVIDRNKVVLKVLKNSLLTVVNDFKIKWDYHLTLLNSFSNAVEFDHLMKNYRSSDSAKALNYIKTLRKLFGTKENPSVFKIEKVPMGARRTFRRFLSVNEIAPEAKADVLHAYGVFYFSAIAQSIAKSRQDLSKREVRSLTNAFNDATRLLFKEVEEKLKTSK
ncbi:MAG: hypothetical protein ABH821_01955 [archaeon]